MIRRKLEMFLNSDFTIVGVACLTISMALATLSTVIDKRTTQLTQLDEQILDRVERLNAVKAELGKAMNAEESQGEYPVREDLALLAAADVIE